MRQARSTRIIRGEVQVLLVNCGQGPFIVTRGMRIAQMVVAPVTTVALVEVGDVDQTGRAACGLRIDRLARGEQPMILLSRRSFLAMAAVVDVALHARPMPVAAKALAARHNLPPRHLETVLQALVRQGILKGVRGPRGGYELARERRRITAGDIVRAAMTATGEDGLPAAPNSKLVDLVVGPVVKRPQKRSCEFDGVTVDDLCRAAEAKRPSTARHSRFHNLGREIPQLSTQTENSDNRPDKSLEDPMAEPARKLEAAQDLDRKPGRGRVYDSITETIGDTPLVRLNRLPQERGVEAEILLKLEFFNPIASVKDRIGVSMIDAIEAAGAIEPGHDPDRADLGQYRHRAGLRGGGARLPADPRHARDHVARAAQDAGVPGRRTGAHPGPDGHEGRDREGARNSRRSPSAVIPQQFQNPANPEIHRRTTAEEIWNDTHGQLDVFVAGVGTGGTITGVGQVLKPRLPNLRVIAVEPEDSPVLSGGQPGPHKIQGIGAGFIPDVLDRSVIDEVDHGRRTRRPSRRRGRFRSSKAFRAASRPAPMSQRRSRSAAVRNEGQADRHGRVLVCRAVYFKRPVRRALRHRLWRGPDRAASGPPFCVGAQFPQAWPEPLPIRPVLLDSNQEFAMADDDARRIRSRTNPLTRSATSSAAAA